MSTGPRARPQRTLPGVFIRLNSAVRRSRRQLAIVAAVLGLAGAVVIAHSAGEHGHVGDALVVCLAVANTAMLALGAALGAARLLRRGLWPVPELSACEPPFGPAPIGINVRAGPHRLQVFRL